MADSPGRLMIKDDNYNSCLLFCRGSSGKCSTAVGGDDRPADREPSVTDFNAVAYKCIDIMPVQDETLVYPDKRIVRQRAFHHPQTIRNRHSTPVDRVKLAITARSLDIKNVSVQKPPAIILPPKKYMSLAVTGFA